MKNRNYFFFILILLQFSCVKDDTVNTFTKINNITIEGMEKSYNIELGSILTIAPDVIEELKGEGELEYVWYKYNVAQYSADTISREKNLSYELDDIVPGVETMLVFKVTNKKTGIYTRKQATLVVSGKYTDGTLMLCRSGNECELSFLKSKMDVLYENVYQDENDGKRLGRQSERLFIINPNLRNTVGYKAVIITSNDNTGGVYLAPHSLKFMNNMVDKFKFADLTGDINITAYSCDESGDYLFVNGKYHPRIIDYSISVADWQPSLFVLSNPKNYYLSDAIAQPFVDPFYGIPLVYDNLNGRFMYNNAFTGYFTLFGKSNVESSAFDPGNMGSLDMIISGCLNGKEDELWALMKDMDNGDYYTITYEVLEDGIIKTLSKKLIDRGKCPNLYNGANFVAGTTRYVENMYPWGSFVYGLSGTFFFSSNDKVYAFNTGTTSEGMIIDAAAENCSITTIKCQQIPEPTKEDPGATYMRLGVALKDKTTSIKPAGIEFYRLSGIAGISAKKYYSKMGIADKIIDFAEKLD